MARQSVFYNPEKDLSENYTEEFRVETVTVKDVTNLRVEHHYWRDADGDLWGDFDNPMENVHRDFEAYRKEKNFLSPAEIHRIREKMGLTVRQFADKLGLGVSTLSQIENNQRIQVKYQDNLFRWANGETFHRQSPGRPKMPLTLNPKDA